MKNFYLFISLLLVLLVGCEGKSSTYDSDIERLAYAYADLIASHHGSLTFQPDSLKVSQRKLPNEILKRHGYNEDEFRKEFVALGNSPEQFRQFLNSVHNILRKRRITH